METLEQEVSLLDKNVYEIDFSKLDPIEELAKINPRFVEAFKELGTGDRILWLRAYEINTPVEEALIQMALDKFEGVRISNSAEAAVRREMAAEAAKGIEIDSPEKEAEWESRLQQARIADAKALQAEKDKRKSQFSGKDNNSPVEEEEKDRMVGSLLEVKGLGEKSVEKLMNAGIKTAMEFEALSNEQIANICGPLVAQKFKK